MTDSVLAAGTISPKFSRTRSRSYLRKARFDDPVEQKDRPTELRLRLSKLLSLLLAALLNAPHIFGHSKESNSNRLDLFTGFEERVGGFACATGGSHERTEHLTILLGIRSELHHGALGGGALRLQPASSHA